jgi:hypothetical protein
MQRYVLLLLALVLCPSLALARTWTSREGKEIIADFVDATEEKVTLKRSDGKVVTFKLELLSEDDQQFIRGILARRIDRSTASSEEPGSPFEAATPAPAAASDLRSAVSSKTKDRDEKDGDEKVEGIGTMRDVNRDASEAKKKMKIENRQWSDAFGNKSAGKFIRFQGNNVLVLRGGRQVPLDYWQLSDEDKEYLQELCEAYGQSHQIPKVNPAEQRNAPGATFAGNRFGSGPAPGISTTPSSPPPGAFAGAPGVSSPPATSGSSPAPRFGNPEELARRMRELEERAKAASTYSPPPAATASSSTFPSPGGTSYSPPPSASASYSPPPTTSYTPPPSASHSPPGSFTSPPGSTMPSSTMPSSSMPGSFPSIPDPTFGAPSMMDAKQCEKCGKVLPATFTAGDRCPGCGVYFSHDNTNGKTANPGIFGGGGGGGPSRGMIKGIIVLVVLGIKGIAFMIWRSQQS